MQKKLILIIAIVVLVALLIFSIYVNKMLVNILFDWVYPVKYHKTLISPLVKLFNWANFKEPDSYKEKIILFYDAGCEHCVKVDNFIKDNKVEEKVEFTRLDIFNNNASTNILLDKAQICGFDYKYIGVPFLWDDRSKKCLIGYVDVINFFKDEISVKKP